MKKLFFFSLFTFLFTVSRAQVSISSTNILPHSSAMLDVGSTSKGLLMPRLTTTQRTAITGTAKGLMVYDSTTNSVWYYNGTSWGELSSIYANTWKTTAANIYNTNTGNVGIGTVNPQQKLDIAGNLALSGDVTISNLADNWLRLNQVGDYSNGIYSPGFLRIDGGIASGSAGSGGAGTITATTSLFAPIFYDWNNTGYYVDPASTTNFNTLRWNNVDCINGTCPPNHAIRLTPNFHINSGTGYAVILNWDNNTTGATQTFRIGNGQGSDAFFVYANGNTFCGGEMNVGALSSGAGKLNVTHTSSLSSPTALLYENSASYARLQFQNNTGSKYWHVAGLIDNTTDANSRLNFYHSVTGDIMSITGDGKVGIGTINPTQKLTVSGNICATGTIASCSDVRYKTNIEPLSDALIAILQLHPIYYNWKQELQQKGFTNTRQIGFSAQEVEHYFPEMVQTDKEGYKAVDYSRMAPVFVEAVKEQESELKAKDQEIAKLEQQLAREQEDIAELKKEMAVLLGRK